MFAAAKMGKNIYHFLAIIKRGVKKKLLQIFLSKHLSQNPKCFLHSVMPNTGENIVFFIWDSDQ